MRWPLPPMCHAAHVCIRPADDGGESLMITNKAVTAAGPQELFDFVKAHGGIRYDKHYYDKQGPPPEPLDVCYCNSRCIYLAIH
jgi:hypothetical protein